MRSNIKQFLVVILIFYIGYYWGNLRFKNSHDWVGGYCWGYVAGLLDRSNGLQHKNVMMILGIKYWGD